MSYLETSNGRDYIFGQGGGQAVADRLSELAGEPVALLGQLPLSANLRSEADGGMPIVISKPEDPAAQEIIRIAKVLAGTPRGLAGKSLPLNVS